MSEAPRHPHKIARGTFLNVRGMDQPAGRCGQRAVANGSVYT